MIQPDSKAGALKANSKGKYFIFVPYYGVDKCVLSNITAIYQDKGQI